MRQGRYADSLQLLDVQLPSKLADSDLVVWQKLTQASSLGYLSQIPEAESALSAAEKLAIPVQSQLQGEVLLRKGTLASLQWQLPEAQALFHQSLRFALEHKDRFLEASSLGSLGVAAARMEHHDESIEWNEKALELVRNQGWLGLASKAEGNLGWSYLELGDLATALDQFETAEQEAVKAGLEHERVLWLTNSAVVRYELHKYAEAQVDAEKALELALKLGDPPDVIECYQNAALIAMQNSRMQDADRDLGEASRLAQSNPDLQRDLYTSLLTAHLAVRRGVPSTAESLYSNLATNPKAPTYVRWEAEAGLAQVYAAQGRLKEAEAQFERAIATIEKARGYLEREDLRFAFLSSAIQFYDQYVNFLVSLNRQEDALKVADLSRAQTLESGLTSWIIGKNGTATPESTKAHATRAYRPIEIAARLRSTLLFYWLGQDKSFLWVVTPSKIHLFALPSSSEIDPAIASYRRVILEDPRDPLESWNTTGRKLYDLLLRPANNVISRNARIIVLPDGNLNGLNFETLPVTEPKPHYWIEEATLSIASSLSLLSRVRIEHAPDFGRLLFFGAPISPSKEFPPLADEKKEIDAITGLFPEGRKTLFLGKDAKASAYLSSDPGKFAFIHFATHGTASVSRPLESSVILTKEGDSFKLYARDIAKHPLKAYLVSISACDGVGKRNFAGDGLVGLSWAFLRAGAHNVVAGLWEVSTASTSPIFNDLYDGILIGGEDPATALRQAKLHLIRAKGPSSRPFYWAPFQLYSGS